MSPRMDRSDQLRHPRQRHKTQKKGASGFSVGATDLSGPRRQNVAMRDTELYRHVLGLEAPWEVNRVELSAEGERIDVWVDHPRGTRWNCPACDACSRPTTTPTNASGATSTPASS